MRVEKIKAVAALGCEEDRRTKALLFGSHCEGEMA
jgi:hypothetical protein